MTDLSLSGHAGGRRPAGALPAKRAAGAGAGERERIADPRRARARGHDGAQYERQPRATRREDAHDIPRSSGRKKTVQPGRAAPFFSFYCSPNSSRTICMRIWLSPPYAREKRKAGDRRILEVVVAEHIAPARPAAPARSASAGTICASSPATVWLSNISMVFQNVYLFNDTIRANIFFIW